MPASRRGWPVRMVTFEPGRPHRLAHAPARPDPDRHRRLRLDAARGRADRGDPARRRGLDPAGREALARRHRDHRHDPHRDPGEAGRQGRRLARAGHRRAVRRGRVREDALPHPGYERPRGLGDRARLHGHEHRLRPAGRPPGDDRAPARRRRAGRHLLRHRRGLRALRQRGAGRRGAGAGPRPGRDRHQVRVPDRCRRAAAAGAGQPAGAHPRGRRGLAAAAAHRGDRPVLPAPGRPGRADRGRGGCRRRT